MVNTRHPYRKGLPEVPILMRSLPIDWRGYPVPHFVAWIKGFPDHRVVEPAKLMRCMRHQLCWICGKPLTAPVVCVVGPMCGVNHISSEPPSHEACARFAAQGCPFLSKPQMHRREAGLPELAPGEKYLEAPGNMLKHNPGVTLLWWTSQVAAFKHGNTPGSTNYLFDIGEPIKVEWWTEGRLATRAECEAAIERGLPNLRGAADSAAEHAHINLRVKALLELLPAA